MYGHIFIRIRFRIHFLVSIVGELGIISTQFLTSNRKNNPTSINNVAGT